MTDTEVWLIFFFRLPIFHWFSPVIFFSFFHFKLSATHRFSYLVGRISFHNCNFQRLFSSKSTFYIPVFTSWLHWTVYYVADGLHWKLWWKLTIVLLLYKSDSMLLDGRPKMKSSRIVVYWLSNIYVRNEVYLD